MYYCDDFEKNNFEYLTGPPAKAPKKRRRSGSLGRYAVVGAVSFALGAGVFASGYHAGGGSGVAAAAPYVERLVYNDVGNGIITLADTNDGALGIPSVSSIVKSAADSVVSINVKSTGRSRYFNTEFNTSGAGSGIIFSEDDTRIYIVTNNHVVEGAKSATISLDDTTEVEANYVGGDSRADIAVISVKKEALVNAGVTSYKIASFGDSDGLEVGDLAVAIGNALGEGKTATFGIISAVNKSINIDNKNLKVIQTDAAINPGNSGGALVNASARIIGINTAKLSDYGVEGMGYSIPINEVRTIVDTLMLSKDKPAVEPAYLGINGQTVTKELKDMYNFPALGVYVAGVFTGTGAYDAGLRRGDLIVGFNGVTITTWEELNAEVAKTTAGQIVELAVYKSSVTPATLMVSMTSQVGGTRF